MNNEFQLQQNKTRFILETSAQLRQNKFSAIGGNQLLSHLQGTNQVSGLSLYWDNLVTDNFMADGGRYRLRRYGQFQAKAGSKVFTQLPHGPYYQPSDVNTLNGDIERVFEPLEEGFCSHPLLLNYLGFLKQVYNHTKGTECDWNVRLHPYRVLASANRTGLPTPEGLHRDGVTFVSALMIQRFNILGGETTVTDTHGNLLFQQQLTQPFDLLVGDDEVTKHMVSPIRQSDPTLGAAYRDVLVVAFTKQHSLTQRVA
jgi:hypothetical protein